MESDSEARNEKTERYFQEARAQVKTLHTGVPSCLLKEVLVREGKEGVSSTPLPITKASDVPAVWRRGVSQPG